MKTCFWIAVLTFFWLSFGMSVTLHRFFSHQAFHASRSMTFVFGIIGLMTNQCGFLWWASKHKKHHKDCDTHLDPHSPNIYSLLYAFIGWTYYENTTEYQTWSKRVLYPELILLNSLEFLPTLFTLYMVYNVGPESLYYYYVPTLLSRYGTFYFNVSTHQKHSNEKTCQAMNKRGFGSSFLGENLHATHHAKPQQLCRHSFDLSYYLCISPMLRLHFIKAP